MILQSVCGAVACGLFSAGGHRSESSLLSYLWYSADASLMRTEGSQPLVGSTFLVSFYFYKIIEEEPKMN